MKTVKTLSKQFVSSKYLRSVRPEQCVQKCGFGSAKKLQFSDLDDEHSTNNSDLLASLSENEVFQSIAPDPSARRRHRGVENAFYKRQSRGRRVVDDGNRFSELLNARSVQEVRNQLEVFKKQSLGRPKYDGKGSRNRIMDILDSIANEDVDKSDEPNDDKSEDAGSPQINDRRDMNKTLAAAYSHAISACGFLKEFEAGFQIFEEAKQNKSVINARVFGTAMWLVMEQELSATSLRKCHQMMDEMQNDFNQRPTSYSYAILIRNQTALRHFNANSKLISSMRESGDFDRFLGSKILQNSIVNYYAKSKQIEEGIKFMELLATNYGNEALNNVIYCTMLSGIALMIKDGDAAYIKVAEKLFEQSFKVLGGPPGESVFGALLGCYANIPDSESCIDVVKNMISNKDWPQPTGFTIANCLKSLTMHFREPMSYEQGWKLVDEILEIMNNVEIAEDVNDEKSAIYGLLFTLCGGKFCNQSDLDKLHMFYDEMKGKGYKMSAPTANSLLLSGIDHYIMEMQNNPDNKEEIKKDLRGFIDWALLQFKENNLSLSARQNQQLQRKLGEIM